MREDFEGANGIKTGYTKYPEVPLQQLNVLVCNWCIVLDCQPWFEDSMTLLNYGFANFKYTIISEKQILGQVPVVDGFEKQVDVVCRERIVLPVKKEEEKKIKIKTHLPHSIKAPVKAGIKAGYVEITLGEDVNIRKDLYTASYIKENTFISNLKRIIDKWLLMKVNKTVTPLEHFRKKVMQIS